MMSGGGGVSMSVIYKVIPLHRKSIMDTDSIPYIADMNGICNMNGICKMSWRSNMPIKVESDEPDTLYELVSYNAASRPISDRVYYNRSKKIFKTATRNCSI